ncbi:DUF1987 domain-containing protein [Marinoscillum sp.]|uniref:DUF1987 domain-containing protein n=1 Tax=Marinoscillum sp. TaxID=2024838 RepID=UPI003BAAAB49
MVDFQIEATLNSPLIRLESDAGRILIQGRSTPESSIGIYFPVIEKVKKLFANVPRIDVTISLLYFNTSSSKCLFDLFKELKRLERRGAELSVHWYYEHDDEDMLETGEDYADILDLPFHFHPLIQMDNDSTPIAC